MPDTSPQATSAKRHSPSSQHEASIRDAMATSTNSSKHEEFRKVAHCLLSFGLPAGHECPHLRQVMVTTFESTAPHSSPSGPIRIAPQQPDPASYPFFPACTWGDPQTGQCNGSLGSKIGVVSILISIFGDTKPSSLLGTSSIPCSFNAFSRLVIKTPAVMNSARIPRTVITPIASMNTPC